MGTQSGGGPQDWSLQSRAGELRGVSEAVCLGLYGSMKAMEGMLRAAEGLK